MLKEIHEQADAVAETIADRTVREDGVDLADEASFDESLLLDVRRIVIVACGTSLPRGPHRPLRDRGVGARARRDGRRVGVPLPQPGRRPGRPRHRHHAVGRDGRHAGRDADRPRARRDACWPITNIMGSQATRDADGVLFTRAGLEVGVAATKTFVCQVAVMYLLGLRLAELRGTLTGERRDELVARAQAHPALASRSCSDAVDAEVEAIADAHWRRGLLPLPRPPRRAAGRARGRAEAQGDLLHLDRRLRGRRDEARADRAARRAHAGRHRRDATRRSSTRSSRTCRRSAPAART